LSEISWGVGAWASSALKPPSIEPTIASPLR
jgi:hypothetical protein